MKVVTKRLLEEQTEDVTVPGRGEKNDAMWHVPHCSHIVNCVGFPTLAPETLLHGWKFPHHGPRRLALDHGVGVRVRDALNRVHTTGDDVGKGNSQDQRCLGSTFALCAISYTARVVHKLEITQGGILVTIVLVYSPPLTSRPEAVIE